MIDALRGAALIGMIVYHAGWNLDTFQFTELGVTSAPGWIGFARLIAGSFVMLSGVSLVLADAAGHDANLKLWRIGKVAIAALLVTIATYFIFPETFVYFGILHLIALSGLLAWPLLRLHWLVVFGLALGIVIINQTVALEFADTRWLAWIGISRFVPPANDYVPIIPWFAVVLLGIPLGHMILSQVWLQNLLAANPRWLVPLGWMGRYSLIIYLIHQPILFGMASTAYYLTR
uniref:heparan-alpha-glucosaminide N-acetyltransferase n=1 Tax=Pararhizobium sp. IMCC3301 TaxID=3067904 RepID=UPI0027420A92|nr:heparan-alpha-glucosaminide N-acetyltransferase [Pararhizobium sp. IMCC3301]